MSVNIMLLNHADWLEQQGLKKEAKECREQAYENNNIRATRNRKNNNVVKSGGSIHTRRNQT
jgi:hypothetical protein